MTAPVSRAAPSYRADLGVPAFDDSGPLTVLDGECALVRSPSSQNNLTASHPTLGVRGYFGPIEGITIYRILLYVGF